MTKGLAGRRGVVTEKIEGADAAAARMPVVATGFDRDANSGAPRSGLR